MAMANSFLEFLFGFILNAICKKKEKNSDREFIESIDDFGNNGLINNKKMLFASQAYFLCLLQAEL